MHELHLVIQPGGRVRCVYDESICLEELGRVCIRRASHVEPDAAGMWHADLSPVGGPKLGPFRRRGEALAAERNWLERHWLLPPKVSLDPSLPILS